MPQLGPAFLHRPLPALPSVSLEAAPRWLLGGLSYFVPAPLRRSLWRPLYQLVHLDDEVRSTAIEEAWSGERRESRASNASTLPLAVALPAARVFETSVDLPAAAINSLRDAISLRLETLSPIAPEEVVFGVGAPKKIGENRIRVPVAITRKTDLQEIEQRFGAERLHAIGAMPGIDGSLRHVFKRFRDGADTLNKTILAGAALFVALVVLLNGISIRLNREIAVLQTHEQSLLSALHHHKELTTWLPSGDFERTGVSGEDLAHAMALLAEALPESARLTSAEFGDGAWSVTGYASDEASWPDQVSPTFTASDRPGFRRFRAEVAPQEAP